MLLWCRAGQELGPSAVLVPLCEALLVLQHNLESDASLLGAITTELLDTLASAAVFQELGSGDMDAVPSLLSCSRLSCLLDFLNAEADALQSDPHHTGKQKESQQQNHSHLTYPNHLDAHGSHVHNQDKATSGVSHPDTVLHQQSPQSFSVQNGPAKVLKPAGAELEDGVCSNANGDSAKVWTCKSGSEDSFRAMVVVAEQVTAQR